MQNYDHKKIEKKWQSEWEKKEIYKTLNSGKGKKMYVLDMFPYPSGVGLHVGHPRGYIGSDVYARMKRMQGYNVLHPMGYDAFGLPAEQYALEHKIHPKKAVEENVKTFERQLSIIGLSYDWSRKVNTTDPKYYKWTQWIFLQIYNSWFDVIKNKARSIKELELIFDKSGNERVNAVCSNDTEIFTAKKWKLFSKKEKQDILMKYRLAYEGYSEVNWCQEMGTVLANDEIVNDIKGNSISERGGYPVEKKLMRQWFMRITAYADRLLSGLDELEWSDHIKEIQRNWIGKSEGSEISFKVRVTKKFSSGPRMREDEEPDHSENLFGNSHLIKVFTTRADTIFGATYVVLAPEHKIITNYKSQITNWEEVEEYISGIKNKTDEDRTKNDKEKTGVELKGIKAINPANGEEIPIWIADYVLASYGTGAIMAVPMHDERDRNFATKFNLPIIDEPLVDASEITRKVGGKIVTKYKMRDAIFARQRYWGEPIPLKHDKDGIIFELKNKDLPLELPKVKSYSFTGTGESPLAGIKSWVKEGYETNTMPGWAGSSWYFLRYMDPENKKEFASKKAINYWKNVDMYVGGAEHATGHLLYSRFWNNFLYDMGYVSFEEPFKRMKNIGMVLATDGRKMSKRWGNVINPDDIVKNYGADTLRVYEMFMGPFEQSLPWSTESIIGSRRFIDRVFRLQEKISDKKSSIEIEKILHKTIKKVSEDIENFAFNTAISSMMILVNEFEKTDFINKDDFKKFLQILSPFAPHITEEIWQNLGEKKSIHKSSWPKWDKKKIIDEMIKIAIQVNGKVRTELIIPIDMTEQKIKDLALKNEKIVVWTQNKEIKKIIYIPHRVINIVV
ncbi:MAG: class I tRNA ligase family protein [Candidatus Paceibacterota bacterium]